MRSRSLITAFVLAALASSVPASGTHEDPCGGSVVTTVQTPLGETYYLDARGSDNGVWTYRESNGIDGLQRGNESIVVEHMVEDPCVDDLTSYGPEAEPDELMI